MHCLHVRDTGFGISSDRAEDVFRPFVRLEPEVTSAAGTGIGLSICRRLIEGMGGKMGFESEPDVGSNFWFTLPGSASQMVNDASAMTDAGVGAPGNAADCAATGDIEGDPEDGPEGGDPDRAGDLDRATGIQESLVTLKQMTEGARAKAADPVAAPVTAPAKSVLYIDDDRANVLLMKAVVAREKNITFYSAPTGELGLAMAQSLLPDLILLDINLPELDGYQVRQRLQDMPQTRAIHVVALSANAYPKDIQKALDSGFDQYLIKPIDIKETQSVFEKYLTD
ncbi:MAG: response regulator [Proteobacteria bacterium]|nr:response regulator [Pseudomonadota bacterium]